MRRAAKPCPVRRYSVRMSKAPAARRPGLSVAARETAAPGVRWLAWAARRGPRALAPRQPFDGQGAVIYKSDPMVVSRQQERLVDLRTIRRNIRAGMLTKDKFDEYLRSLPDMSENIAPPSSHGR
jgi:hypothetical protein